MQFNYFKIKRKMESLFRSYFEYLNFFSNQFSDHFQCLNEYSNVSNFILVLTFITDITKNIVQAYRGYLNQFTCLMKDG